MKRNEKIEVLTSIKNGTPISLAFSELVTLLNTLDEPNIYYDIYCNIVDLEYYKQHCKKLSFITTVNNDELKKNCILLQKMMLDINEVADDELKEVISIFDKSDELQKKSN